MQGIGETGSFVLIRDVHWQGFQQERASFFSTR